MAWSKCTKQQGDFLFVNLDNVRYMTRGDDNLTAIFLIGEPGADSLSVQETPEVILQTAMAVPP